MERQFTLIATGGADKKSVLDENLARFLTAFAGFASDISKVRPYFVSDDAIDGIIEATRAATLVRAASVAEQRLSKISDGDLRRQDEEASVISDVVADAERRRLLADRAAAESRALETMSEEDQIKSLFSYGAPTGGVPASSGGGGGYCSGGSNSFTGGLLHYQAELQRLRALVIPTDLTESHSNGPVRAAHQPHAQAQRHNADRGGGVGRSGTTQHAKTTAPGTCGDGHAKRRDRASRKGSFL
jgi:hypothetical protein